MADERAAVVWVVAAALVTQDGHVLMQRRPRTRSHGGLWEFPGGKVEPAETPEAATVREIGEELGVVLDPARLRPVGFASSGAVTPGAPLEGTGRPHVILLYACHDWRGEPRCLDAEAIAWVPATALCELAMPPLDYPLARALIAGLHGI